MDKTRSEVSISDGRVKRVVVFAELGAVVVNRVIFGVVPTWAFALDGYGYITVQAEQTKRGFSLTVDNALPKNEHEIHLLEIALIDKANSFVAEICRLEALADDIRKVTKLYDLQSQPLQQLIIRVSNLEGLEAQATEGQEPDSVLDPDSLAKRRHTKSRSSPRVGESSSRWSSFPCTRGS